MSDKSERTTLNPSILSAADSPVRTFQTRERGQGLTEPDRDCGQNTRESFASFDPVSLLWKTCQRSLLGGWVEFSGTWPRAGMMRSGTAYPLPPSAPLTAETGSLLWPTPTVNGNHNKKGLSKKSGDGLATAVKKWPTPTARDWKDTGRPEMLAKYAHKKRLDCSVAALDTSKPGSLNPNWVEWLQGFPVGWTELDASETPYFRRWLK